MNHNSIAKTPQQLHILSTQWDNFTIKAKLSHKGTRISLTVNIVNQIEYHHKMGIEMVCDKINPFL